MAESKSLYVCGVDWQHEIGNVKGWSGPVYGSVEECKKFSKCWEQCGIVEVQMTLVKWHEPQDLFKKSGDKQDA
jgi:hypothetical protein